MVKNGTETDVDCGGSCGPCGAGKACGAGKDCTSTICTGNVCTTASCTDGVKNGTETDVDCGGTCTGCGLSKTCSGDADCAGTLCRGSKCGLGSGSGGPIEVKAGMTLTINTVSTSVAGTAGATTMTFTSGVGFAPGNSLLIHQSQGTNAGVWELQTLTGLAGSTATVGTKLKNTYTAGAQAVLVPEFTTVAVDATAVLNAPAWNGGSGGILAFMANGAVS